MPEFEFPPGVPEELKEFVIKKVTRQEMEVDATRHELARFFEELNPEQLRTLCHLFGQMDRKIAMYYLGYVTSLLQTKFNLCAGCGRDHDKELFEPHDEVTVIEGDGTGKRLPPIDEHGNRVDTCSSCHGDRVFDVCGHPTGSHGQGGRETCPEPTKVPCPECETPPWYKADSLPHCGQCRTGTLLPLPRINTFMCFNCGVVVSIKD